MRKNIPVILAIGFTSYDVKSHLKKMTVNTDIKYLTKLAEQGDARAQTDLGLIYGNGSTKDYTKAFYWYNKAAQQNYAPAQFNIGLFYENGWTGIRDLKLARDFYYKAAKQGFIDAQVNLGILLIEGKGGA